MPVLLLPERRCAVVMLDLVIGALAEVFAAVVAATILAFLCWNMFKLVLHPEWGPWLAFALVVGALFAHLPINHVLSLVAIFGLIAAVCTWSEGAEWRKRRSIRSPWSGRRLE